VFSDEKVFQSSHNGRVRVYRPRNSRYDERYVEPTERSGRFSVNVWGCISAVSPGVMLQVEERLNSGVYIRILENVMRPSVTRVYPNQNFIFQQDNCSVHTSHRVATWFQDQNINRSYRELRFKKIQESLVLNPRGMNLFALFLHKCIFMYNMCVLDLLQAMRKCVFMQVSQRQNDKS
jgi:hypothetical protein